MPGGGDLLVHACSFPSQVVSIVSIVPARSPLDRLNEQALTAADDPAGQPMKDAGRALEAKPLVEARSRDEAVDPAMEEREKPERAPSAADREADRDEK